MLKTTTAKKKKRKDIQRLNVKFGGGQRLAYGKAGFNSSSGSGVGRVKRGISGMIWLQREQL